MCPMGQMVAKYSQALLLDTNLHQIKVCPPARIEDTQPNSCQELLLNLQTIVCQDSVVLNTQQIRQPNLRETKTRTELSNNTVVG